MWCWFDAKVFYEKPQWNCDLATNKVELVNCNMYKTNNCYPGIIALYQINWQNYQSGSSVYIEDCNFRK